MKESENGREMEMEQSFSDVRSPSKYEMPAVYTIRGLYRCDICTYASLYALWKYPKVFISAAASLK